MRRYLFALAIVAMATSAAFGDEPATPAAPSPVPIAADNPAPAKRKATNAVWIAVGATFLGSAVAIGSVLAARSKGKPRPAGDDLA